MWKVPHILKKDWREPSYYLDLADPEILCLVKYKQKTKFALPPIQMPFRKWWKPYLRCLSTHFWPLSYAEPRKTAEKQAGFFFFFFNFSAETSVAEHCRKDRLYRSWSHRLTKWHRRPPLPLKEEHQNPEVLRYVNIRTWGSYNSQCCHLVIILLLSMFSFQQKITRYTKKQESLSIYRKKCHQ